MIKSSAAKILAALALTLAAGATAFAQFSPDSPAGFDTSVIRLFNGINAFTAAADVQMVDTNRQEMGRMPMTFALRDGKLRIDMDLMQMKGRNIEPRAVAWLQQVGLDRLAVIMRPDRKRVYIAFPRAKSYVDRQMSDADLEATGKNAQLRTTPLGNETLDGHSCAKNKLTLVKSKGAPPLEAFTWNAADLKGFPVQITMPAKEGTAIIRFSKVQLARPDAPQFEAPAGFAKFSGADALMLSISLKQSMAQKTAPSRPAPKAATKTQPNPPANPAKK